MLPPDKIHNNMYLGHCSSLTTFDIPQLQQKKTKLVPQSEKKLGEKRKNLIQLLIGCNIEPFVFNIPIIS